MSNWMDSCEYLAEESTCEATCDCKYKMYDCNPDGSVNCYICGWVEEKNNDN